MSNPGVITLSNSSSKKGRFKRFAIEDNIGESIHLHFDNMRLDFTIDEFLNFSKIIRNSLSKLNIINGYSIDTFDEYFLLGCSDFLSKLKNIKIEEINLSNLNCIIREPFWRDLDLSKLVKVSETPSFKFLKGETKNFLTYKQYNYFGINNEKRLLNLVNSINHNGYPYLNKHIILFNDEDIIRDGQHRAAILAHLYGIDHKVKVMRFIFSDRDNNINIVKNNFKKATLWFAKKLYRKLKQYI